MLLERLCRASVISHLAAQSVPVILARPRLPTTTPHPAQTELRYSNKISVDRMKKSFAFMLLLALPAGASAQDGALEVAAAQQGAAAGGQALATVNGVLTNAANLTNALNGLGLIGGGLGVAGAATAGVAAVGLGAALSASGQGEGGGSTASTSGTSSSSGTN